MSIQKSPIMMLMLALFLVLVGSTIWRIMTALETHPGMVVADAYETGERYGATLEKRQKLQEQGWKLELKIPEVVTHGIMQTYVAVSTKQEKRLNKADATAYFYRPLEMKHDFSLPMNRTNDGAYQLEVELPLKGRWDLLVEVSKGDFRQQNSARMFAQ
ncbi:FixH family protein [Candidatus Thioglobus sp.]|uniref:FixH family protein n=1 Tax=Candidatus Thioglobus sp. TaxID=2026721 RepID=UPI003D11CDAE